MPRVNVIDYLDLAAHPGRITGQTPAHTQIQAAIQAAGPNGIVYFPTGKYLINQPLATYVSTPQGEGGVSLQGDGWQSAIIVRLDDPAAVAFTLNNSALASPLDSTDPAYASAPQYRSKPVEGLEWSNIAILGGWVPGATQGTRVACCHTGLQMDLVLRSSFRNVHVLLAASHHCVYMRAGWSNHYGFISSAELGQRLYGALPGYPANTYAGPPAVTHIRGGPNVKYVGGLNANTYDCLVEGGSTLSSGATLLAIDDQYTVFRELKSGVWQDTPAHPQGNNLFRGTYEGTRQETGGYTGYGILLGRSFQPSIRDFHLEHTAGLRVEGGDGLTVEQGAVQDVALVGTSRVLLDQMSVATVSIDAASSFTRLGALSYEGKDVSAGGNGRGLGLMDASATTVSLGSGPYLLRGTGARLTASALTNADNRVHNGDFSRWLSTGPEGWSASIGALTQATGTEARRPGTSAAKFTSATAAGLPYAAYRLEGVAGEWVGVSGYVRVPTGQPGAVVELALQSAGAQTVIIQTDQTATDNGAWTRVEAVFHLAPGSVHDILFRIRERAANAAVVMYVADVQASEGVIAPSHTFVPPANVADSYQLAGRRISYGSAKPSGGTARQGDIVYNTNPASGQPVGWVCTAEPATWNGFGVVQAT